ncbi:MAG: hypothetical protein IKH48_00665, partial [Prevotella sp.]|nr:hypothetical protein [Prevotella sp.]
ALLTAMPAAMTAQENIQKAFEALLNDKIVETKTQHSLERDPETGQKSAQADVYDFVVTNASALSRIKDIEKAFEKDKNAAYQIRSGNGNAGRNNVSLAVGNNRSQSVSIGSMKGSNYIYACFLDPDDAEKKYRYAYAMEWLDKGQKTQVRLVITYATTQKYREKNSTRRRIIINGQEINVDGGNFSGFSLDNSSVFVNDSVYSLQRTNGGWLTQFNIYKNRFLKNPEGIAANTYVTQIYNLCKKADALDDDEKELVADELKRMKTKTEDELIQKLFDMSIERLKK